MTTYEKVAVSITIEPELLGEIDARVTKLDLNRSQYFRRLAREDLAKLQIPRATESEVVE